MHHITYTDYAGREAVVKLSAAQISTVMFFTSALREAGIEYTHIFWD